VASANPITEFQTIRFGVSLQSSQLLANNGGSAQQALFWVQNNGNSRTRTVHDDYYGDITFSETRFKTAELNLGWSFNSLNRALFPDRGTRHSVGLSYTAPGSEVKYYVASYDFLNFIPFWKNFALSTNLSAAYGGALSDTTSLPPYRNFYAGGPDSVRGYRESRLGPKDNFGNPYGGNLRTTGRAEVILPMPQKFASSARLSLFYDIGNVFSTNGVSFPSKQAPVIDETTGQVAGSKTIPLNYKFKYSSLKKSAGISVQWLAPLGLFRFSYAFPMNADKGDDFRYEDEVERFQFSIGQAF